MIHIYIYMLDYIGSCIISIDVNLNLNQMKVPKHWPIMKRTLPTRDFNTRPEPKAMTRTAWGQSQWCPTAGARPRHLTPWGCHNCPNVFYSVVWKITVFEKTPWKAQHAQHCLINPRNCGFVEQFENIVASRHATIHWMEHIVQKPGYWIRPGHLLVSFVLLVLKLMPHRPDPKDWNLEKNMKKSRMGLFGSIPMNLRYVQDFYARCLWHSLWNKQRQTMVDMINIHEYRQQRNGQPPLHFSVRPSQTSG